MTIGYSPRRALDGAVRPAVEDIEVGEDHGARGANEPLGAVRPAQLRDARGVARGARRARGVRVALAGDAATDERVREPGAITQ